MSTVPEISEEKEEKITPINLTKTPIPENPDQNESPQPDSTKNPLQNVPSKQDSTADNHENGVQNQETAGSDHYNSKKNASCFPLFTSKTKKSQLNEPAEVQSSAATSAYSSRDEISKSVTADIKYISDEYQKLDKIKESLESQLTELSQRLELLKKEGSDKELHNLQKEVTKLKFKIPSQHKGDIEEKDPHKSQQQPDGILKTKPKSIPEKVMQQMPQLYKSSCFENSSEFKGLEANFDVLPVDLKLCLLCFAVFPENAIIKKRLMVYWWMAEGFVPPIPRDEETKRQIEKGRTAEEFAGDYFQKLTKMGFIEPVNKKRCLSEGCYKVPAFIRLALVTLAEKAKFFEFNEEGEPTQVFSRTLNSCLVGKGLMDYGDLRAGRVKIQDLEKLHAVININEPILEFKKDWLLNMTNVVILYLGRWTVSATHHIEIEDEEEKDFLAGLNNMAHLRFFSLQGVSRIMELPEAVLRLSNLMILDLRACHNLESIPGAIGSLKNLTHLDISECYLLEHMPKELALLKELRVLKGFVIGENQIKLTCRLDDLANLEKLVKLSIYTGLVEFPADQHINALQNFKALCKLTIAWGGGALQDEFSKSGRVAKPNDKGKRKDNVKDNPGSHATQSESRSTSEAPKQDDGKDRNENTKETTGGHGLQAKTVETIPEAPPTSADGGGNKEIKQEGSLEAQSSKTSEPSKPNDEGKRKKVTTIAEKSEGGALDARGGEKMKKNAKEKQAKTLINVPTFSKKPASKPQTLKLDGLQKLDLKSFPTATTPKWLTPSNLPSLQKLYIRGDRFSDLGQYQDLDQDEVEWGSAKKHKWSVKILRLKYLSELEMDWMELQELFPELIYLEKVNCPKLSFFPCDGYGVWINKDKLKGTQGRT